MATVDRQALLAAIMDALFEGAFVERSGDRMPVFARADTANPMRILEWLPHDQVANAVADAVERLLDEDGGERGEPDLSVTIEGGRERLVFTSGDGCYYEPADDEVAALFDEAGGMTPRESAVLRALLTLGLKRLNEHDRPQRLRFPPFGPMFATEVDAAEAAEPAESAEPGERS